MTVTRFVPRPWLASRISTPWSAANVADLGDRPADLFDRLLLGDSLVRQQRVGKDADPDRADILGQQRVLFGAFDVLAKLSAGRASGRRNRWPG